MRILRSDGELLAGYAASGDERAFAELVARHGPMVRAACERLAGADADDAAQAVFVLLERRAGRLAGRRDVSSWLHQTCRLVAMTARRERQRRAQREREAAMLRAAGAGDRLSAEQREELRRHVDDAVAALPARFRRVVVLCHLEGASQQEAAERLGLPAGTVATRAMRGLERLRSRLGARGLELGAAALGAALLEGARGAALSFEVSGLLPAVLSASKGFAAGAASGAAGPGAVLLAKGAMQAMFWTKVKLASAVLAGVIAAGAAVPLAAAAVRGAEPAEPRAEGEKPEPRPAPAPAPAPVPAPLPPLQAGGGAVVQVMTSADGEGPAGRTTAAEVARCAAEADLVAIVKVTSIGAAPVKGEPGPAAEKMALAPGASDKAVEAELVEALAGKCSGRKLAILATVRGEGDRPWVVFSQKQEVPDAAGAAKRTLVRSSLVPFTLKEGEKAVVFLKLEPEGKKEEGKPAAPSYRLLPPLLAKTDQAAVDMVRDGLKLLAEWNEDPQISAQQAEELDGWIKRLGSPEFKLREEAVKALIAFGRNARGKIREAMKSSDAEVSSRAKEAYEAIKPDWMKAGDAGVRMGPDGQMIIGGGSGEVQVRIEAGN